MKKYIIGDIFEIKTKKGNGYFQYVYDDELNGEMIRIFYKLHKKRLVTFKSFVGDKEYYYVGFPLKFAVKRKLVELVGHVDIENDFEKPKYARDSHIIRGEFFGWHIIDRTTLKQVLVQELTEDQKKLSLFGIVNDTYIKDRFEEGWTLENWLSDRSVGDGKAEEMMRKYRENMEKSEPLEVLKMKVRKGAAGIHVRIISDDSIVESKSLESRHKLEDMIEEKSVGVIYDVGSGDGFMDVKIDVKDVVLALDKLKVILEELNLTKCSDIGTDYIYDSD